MATRNRIIRLNLKLFPNILGMVPLPEVIPLVPTVPRSKQLEVRDGEENRTKNSHHHAAHHRAGADGLRSSERTALQTEIPYPGGRLGRRFCWNNGGGGGKRTGCCPDQRCASGRPRRRLGNSAATAGHPAQMESYSAAGASRPPRLCRSIWRGPPRHLFPDRS